MGLRMKKYHATKNLSISRCEIQDGRNGPAKSIINKAIAMMRRKSPPSENILCLIENHFQTNISKGRRGKALILFS